MSKTSKTIQADVILTSITAHADSLSPLARAEFLTRVQQHCRHLPRVPIPAPKRSARPGLAADDV